MDEKKPRGRPPGARKNAVNLYMRLATDVVAIADQHAAMYGSRTASIEALVRIAGGVVRREHLAGGPGPEVGA